MGDLNRIYEYFKYRYNFVIPRIYRRHRQYFSIENRGFGEDAFHAAWYELFKEYRPSNCLEIGVYRGQTISLWGIIQKNLGIQGEVWGLSPLNSSGDKVSRYIEIDYEADISEHFKVFGLGEPKLFQASSTSESAKAFVGKRKWNLIYIDGDHDEAAVFSDFALAFENLDTGGIVVLDDSSLYLPYKPDVNSFAGHPGPSKVLLQEAVKSMNHLFTVGHLNFLNKKAQDIGKKDLQFEG